MRMRAFLLSIALALAGSAPAAAAPPAYTSYTSPTLQPFGDDEAFLDYLSAARTAAHALGRWWYDNPPATPAAASWGLEPLPGSHGEWDYEESSLPGGGSLYYSRVDLTEIRPGVDITWPGMHRRGRIRAGDTVGTPFEYYRPARRHPLWSPGEIYRPVRDTLEPTIHSLTICTRQAVLGGHPSGCRTTAFVGPRGGKLLVTETHAYLWTAPEYGDLEALKADPACRLRAAALMAEGLPSLVYRLPLDGGPLEVVGTRGAPDSDPPFHIQGGRLRAFIAWPRVQCAGDPRPAPESPPERYTLLDAPLALFGRRLAETPPIFETRLPATSTGLVLDSFTGDWLLYGDQSYDFSVPYGDGPPRSGRLFAVPLARPTQVRPVELAHNLVLIVPAGRWALATGYRDSTGIALSVVELGAEPHIVSPSTSETSPARSIPRLDPRHSPPRRLGDDPASRLGSRRSARPAEFVSL
jgi:hypothetical protein